ncbi:MAG TPA: beta-ketoacyl-ACP synthase II [Dehalococcoidia bacterium]|nr:beta-ketoacyl-ACP synthase II [Dehalococcoidia bacterium]
MDGRLRVVITGMGAITPLGLTVEEFWQGCVEGRSGVDYLTLVDPNDCPVKIAGEVKGFDPHNYLDRKTARRMARFSQLAAAASQEALATAELRLEEEDRERVGVLLGNGIGGLPVLQEAVQTFMTKGGMRINPLSLPKFLANMAAANIGILLGIKGYNNTVITACAAATQAIGDALEVVRRGAADVMLAGGTEAALSDVGLAAFAVMGALSTNNSFPPQKVSRPFDAKRDGFVAAEGAAIFILESLEHAQRRDAPILCELAGYSATADAFHIVAPCSDGEGAIRTMRWALRDAGVGPEAVDYISAHGTSTPLNDVTETLAIKALFGEDAYRTPISSVKSMTGHALGAAGALESIACVKSILTGIIPPTINYEYPDPECDLDYVPNVARQVPVRTVLKNSFGFGGQNACLVFRRYEG